MQVSDARSVDDARQLELGADVLEQPSPLTQEDGDEVDLQFVEHPARRQDCASSAPWTRRFASPDACVAWRIALSTPSVT
jgi:hypothetical protein